MDIYKSSSQACLENLLLENTIHIINIRPEKFNQTFAGLGPAKP